MNPTQTPKRIALLGSTGSIGRQTLQVIAEHADLFEVEVLTAGTQAELLAEQARRFAPNCVVIGDESKYPWLQEALADLPIKVYCGAEALCDVVQSDRVDTVLMALVGFAGFMPMHCAIRAGKAIALANKETLVVGGELFTQLAMEHRVTVLPVDSEHSAIFQCLAGEGDNPVRRILLTASGGPFRKFGREQLAGITPEQALQHPNWAMGAKITIDSATMMNKGFEMIEAHWLFGIAPEQIQVLVHPQSVVHSAVEFVDGAVKAQLGIPDMRLPIQYALTYPNRLPLSAPALDLLAVGSLTFEAPDLERFPCLSLAYEALRRGGTASCAMNAANEVANLAFRQKRIGYNDIYRIISQTMDCATFDARPHLDTYLAIDAEARQLATELLTH